MKDDIRHILDAYLQNTLDAREKQQLETRLAKDPDFAKEWEEWIFFAERGGDIQATFAKREQAFSLGLADAAAEKSTSFPWWQLAAAILLLAGLSWIIGSRFQADTDWSAQFAWTELPALRGETDGLTKLIEPGLNGDYQAVVDQLMQKKQQEGSLSPEANVYLGRALWLTGQTDKARRLWRSMLTDSDLLPDRRLSVQWWLGMTAMAENDCTAAKQYWQPLLKSGPKNQADKAREWLENCP